MCNFHESYKGNLTEGRKPPVDIFPLCFTTMKMFFITLFPQYEQGISTWYYWEHKQNARVAILQTIFPTSSSKELKVNSAPVLSLFLPMAKQPINYWLILGGWGELQLSELQSRTNLYFDPLSSLDSARFASKVSGTSMCGWTAESSLSLIPVVFVFKDSVQWLKSLMLQLGAHHPACLHSSKCSVRPFQPNSAGMSVHRHSSCHKKQKCCMNLGTEFDIMFNEIWKCLSGFTSVFSAAYNPLLYFNNFESAQP